MSTTGWWPRWGTRYAAPRITVDEGCERSVDRALYARLLLVQSVFDTEERTARAMAARTLTKEWGRWTIENKGGPEPRVVDKRILRIFETAYALPHDALSTQQGFPRNAIELLAHSAASPQWFSPPTHPTHEPRREDLHNLEHHARTAIAKNLRTTAGCGLIALAIGAVLLLGSWMALPEPVTSAVLAISGAATILVPFVSVLRATRDRVKLLRLESAQFTHELQRRLHRHIGLHLQQLVADGASTTELARVLCYAPTLTYTTVQKLSGSPATFLRTSTHR